MIQKNSIFNVKDSCNINTVKTIHIYKKFYKNIGNSGFITKISLKNYNRKKKRWKGRLSKSVVLLHKVRFVKPDKSQLIFFQNTCALLKKRLSMRGKLVKGPFVSNIKKKKFLKSFISII